jgi:hypothetical protein
MSRARVLLIAAVMAVLAVAAVAVGIVAFGSFDPIDTALIMIGLPIVVAVGGTPIVAVVCFLKGRAAAGWMAALTLPAIAVAFGGGRLWFENQEFDGFEGIGPALLMFMLIVGVGGSLAALGWSGAFIFARPESVWARRWYGPEKMVAAIEKTPMRIGSVEPSRGDWPSRD